MNTTSSPSNARAVILAAVDSTDASTLAVNAAARFATLPGSEIHFVHVLDASDAKSHERGLERGRAVLDHVAKLSGLGDRASYHLTAGTAWQKIVQLATDLHADLIVVGTHDRKPMQRLVLGSVAEQVMRKALCPVYVARRIAYGDQFPEIEPPCTACLAVQSQSAGRTLWCERHSRHHVAGRVHYEIPPSFTAGSNLIRV
jgi:nucleotide-binding universal stress UspA family protein